MSGSAAGVDLTSARSVHIVGIGGAGMRAIAHVLVGMGHQVSGSDRVESSFLEDLRSLGVTVHVGHRGSQVAGADFVTRSTAVPDDNPEIVAALTQGIPVHSRAETLAAITRIRPAILIAGTHGKTTTASMLAVILDDAGLEPSFVIGADVVGFGTGARWSTSETFVVEADESDGTFLSLSASHGVVTSLDPDHLDFYGSPERLAEAFADFIAGIDGPVAVYGDDPDTAQLAELDGVVTYGLSPGTDLMVAGLEVGSDSSSFDVSWRGTHLGRATVAMPGRHNVLNAAAAMVIALSISIPFERVVAGLARYAGVARRFETRGKHLGVRLVDDYAHLPAEVEAVIDAARQGPWRRVVAAYQPHRYSRTEALGHTFAESFRGVDHLVLTDIYPSGERPRPGISGRLVYDAVAEACPDLSLSWQPTLDDVAQHLAGFVGPGDLCLTLGAGDLTSVPPLVLDLLHRRSSVSADWLRSLEPQLTESAVEYNASLGSRTTYRVGGAALAVCDIGSRRDLDKIVVGAIENKTPILPVGRGSNMLVADRGYPGVAVVLGGEFTDVGIEDTTITAGAAASLPAVARRLVATGLTGFEWAVGVPGTVGGAVVMNAGGHGADMAEVLVEATVLDLRSGDVVTRTADGLELGYRQSNVAEHEMVLDATLRLANGDAGTSEQLISEIVRWRRENQPGGQNAGSVFTNPPGDSAGRLIDAAGGRGLRFGTAQVSPKHANFIQADAGGQARDVQELMSRLIDMVENSTGVRLVPETRLVGFEDMS